MGSRKKFSHSPLKRHRILGFSFQKLVPLVIFFKNKVWHRILPLVMFRMHNSEHITL